MARLGVHNPASFLPGNVLLQSLRDLLALGIVVPDPMAPVDALGRTFLSLRAGGGLLGHRGASLLYVLRRMRALGMDTATVARLSDVTGPALKELLDLMQVTLNPKLNPKP